MQSGRAAAPPDASETPLIYSKHIKFVILKWPPLYRHLILGLCDDMRGVFFILIELLRDVSEGINAPGHEVLKEYSNIIHRHNEMC